MDRDLNYFDRGPYGHPLASLAKTPYDAIKREPKKSYQSLEVNSSYDYLCHSVTSHNLNFEVI